MRTFIRNLEEAERAAERAAEAEMAKRAVPLMSRRSKAFRPFRWG
jgi:hypothetical protein